MMRELTLYLCISSLMFISHTSDASQTPNLCFALPSTPVSAYIPAQKITTMTTDAQYRAPTTSPRLHTLDVLSIGMSIDTYRQGQIWHVLQEQSAGQPNSLHVGSALPMDPKKYPVLADDKDAAYSQRETDALELGLKDFPEKWPIPTITVVSGWDPDAMNLRFTPPRTRNSLAAMVNDMRSPAGLHWHRIRNLKNGIICDDTPEGLVEALFQLFEHNPDLPAVLVYSNEGFNMAYSLSSKDTPLIGGGGPRKPGELTDAMVALIVGRPERVEWLRYYAQYAKVNDNKIDPEFRGWGWRKPPVEFQPSEFIPQPWTQRAFEQWDAMQVLAKIHRPVKVSLKRPDNGERLKREALSAQLAAGWNKATDALVPKPARLFYDGGLNSRPIAELSPALHAAHSSLDLLDSRESYDLTQRLGDTGSASPFVGIALATMASYLNADTSVVMPMRRQDQATIIPITSATPGKKPVSNPFGINLMPQTASSDETPEIKPEPVRQVPAIRPLAEVEFTLRKRAGKPERVGKHTPPYVYPLRLKGEGTWDDTGLPFKQKLSLVRAELEVGGKVLLTAPLLPVAAIADFKADGVVTAPGGDSPSGIYQSTDSLDPVDAAIAVSNKGWIPQDTRHARHALMSEADAFKQGRDNASIEAVLNEGKEKAHMTHVFSARAKGDGQVLVTRSETPYEARLRLQKEYNEPLSFHSAIPNNPEHSRQVLAYDVAIGAGESVDDVTFYAYLCRVADWRQDWKAKDKGGRSQADAEIEMPEESALVFYRIENDQNRFLIDSTVAYRLSGDFPTTVGSHIPSLVVSQTSASREASKSSTVGRSV